jgi:hypothetical protein
VQIATPAHLRGRVSAMFVVCTGLISMGLGPTTVGFVTDVVFRDEMKVGWSMIVSLVVVLPLAIAALSLGRTKLGGMMDASAAPAAA